MAAVQIIPIKVGVVLDMDGYGEMALTCISMALGDFYATHDHYKTRLVLTNRDSKGDVVGAAAAALDLLKNVEVQAIIGPMFSYQANFLIALGHKAQVPIITFSATTPLLTSLRSPYFIRTTLNDYSQVDAIVAIIQAFGWREVVQIYEDNEFGEGIIPYLTGALEKVNIRVPYRSAISPLATDDQIVAELNKLTNMQTRVFVVHMLSPLASHLFTKAKQLGMMSREYAWIITDGVTNELKSMDQFVKESMLGVIGVKPYVPKTKELNDFAIRYTEMVQKKSTPDFDIFGLWAYDSAIALAMAAEKAIMRNPEYRKTNISRNSTELEAIGVSETGPKLIQALSTTTFKGLAGDFELVNGQLQAPPFQIVNMVGPGERGIGYWTKENGIIRELNFTSANKKQYFTSKSNLGSIIWPGDASSPPKGWEIPTNGKKLRVGVPVKDGFTEFMHVTWNSDNSTNVEGYCKDIFDAVMAALPYDVPYEYIPFATPDHKMAGDYNDLVYQVYLKNYDAVAGDITIIANRSQYIDFTLPYTDSGILMVVPIQDDKHKNKWIFVKPLTWELWLTSFFSFVFIGVLIWLLEHRVNEDFRGPFWYQVFPRGSPLAPDVSRAILNVTEGPKMVEIDNKWFRNLTKCPDPDASYPSKSLGLASFWGLFSIIGIAGIAAFIIYVIRFLRENRSVIERPDPESTTWSKILELLQKFDDKDLRSHTFQKRILTEREDGCCGDCKHSNHINYQQSPSSFSLDSPRTNSPPSPVPSSPSEHNINFQGDQRSSSEIATTRQQGELSHMINRETELANLNTDERITSRLAHGVN
ncbi:hypothetical protein DH2020_001686 [Rehmannia glutinosa]|uniref:Glutamate receptor n=1 Tax=Rehmannia glutinosa TaxID=99300 RepID=A0ABR0XRL8_REHGL